MKYKIDCANWGGTAIESDSVLSALAENDIVSVTPVDVKEYPEQAGMFLIKEMCDEYFIGFLTPEQLAALGRELIELSGVQPSVALQSAPLDKVYVALSQAE